MVNAQASSSAAAAKASFRKSCDVCQRTYYSENAFQNHVGSQKHQARLVGQMGALGGETGSWMSSAFSLGDPIETAVLHDKPDSAASPEFAQLNDASVSEKEPRSPRPTSPHHSVEDDGSPHPISPVATQKAGAAANNPTAADLANRAPLSRCVFCNYDSPSIPLNVEHMRKVHGMFIPEQSYLVDLPGLVGYLHDKVFHDHACLLCATVKGTAAGAQTHMRDKGHCIIAFDSDEEMLEIGQFYDFRTSYSDPGEDEDEDDEYGNQASLNTAGVELAPKNPRQRGAVSPADGPGGGEDGDGWETDTSASSLDSADLTAVPLDHRHQYRRLTQHPHHSTHEPRPHHLKDGWHSHAHAHPHAAYYADHELHLPSGRSVGHRSLARYYRQNLHHHPNPDDEPDQLRLEHSSDRTDDDGDDDVLGRSSALTRTRELGMVGVSDAKRKEVAAIEARDRRREQRERNRQQWGVDKKGNSQKHFRVGPVLFSSYASSSPCTGCEVVHYSNLIGQDPLLQ